MTCCRPSSWWISGSSLNMLDWPGLITALINSLWDHIYAEQLPLTNSRTTRVLPTGQMFETSLTDSTNKENKPLIRPRWRECRRRLLNHEGGQTAALYKENRAFEFLTPWLPTCLLAKQKPNCQRNTSCVYKWQRKANISHPKNNINTNQWILQHYGGRRPSFLPASLSNPEAHLFWTKFQ